MSFNRLKMAFFQGVAAMLGPPLAGVLVEATGHQGPALQVHLMLGSESLRIFCGRARYSPPGVHLFPCLLLGSESFFTSFVDPASNVLFGNWILNQYGNAFDLTFVHFTPSSLELFSLLLWLFTCLQVTQSFHTSKLFVFFKNSFSYATCPFTLCVAQDGAETQGLSYAVTFSTFLLVAF